MTNENIYYLTAVNGFTKTVYPMKNVNGINAHIGHIKITYGRSNHTYFTKDKKQDLDLWKIILKNFRVACLPLLFLLFRGDEL